VKRIPESRIREIINEYEVMLMALLDEYDDETDVEPADSHSPYSPTGRTGGSLPKEAAARPTEKVQIPASLVVEDEVKKAKR